MHTSHILRRRPFEPTSIVDWPKLASVNRDLPLIGCCARQSQRTHSHSFGCPFQWGGPKTLLSEKRLDKHYGNPHSNNVIGCDSELFFSVSVRVTKPPNPRFQRSPPHYLWMKFVAHWPRGLLLSRPFWAVSESLFVDMNASHIHSPSLSHQWVILWEKKDGQVYLLHFSSIGTCMLQFSIFLTMSATVSVCAKLRY